MITWDDSGSRIFEAGIDRGVFYPSLGPGVPWNGLLSVTQSVENTGLATFYIDGRKQISKLELGNFSAKVEAFTYPSEMLPYDGYSQLLNGQKRSVFNLSYRSLLANDVDGTSLGYSLHLVYNCMLAPTNRDNQSLNADSEIMDFSWDLSTVPIAIPNYRPTAHLYLESTTVEQGALAAIEAVLYGGVGVAPRFPTISEIMEIFEANAIVTIIDNGDGSFTASGPDEDVFETSDPTEWIFTWPNVIELDPVTYKVSSY